MLIAKFVPNSGIPKVPVLHKICSSVTPKAFGDVNKLMTFLSSKGISRIFTFVVSPKYLSIVGSSCPRISSFRTLSWIAWKSKCVVYQVLSGSSAGYWYGVKSKTSIYCGITIIPPGC